MKGMTQMAAKSKQPQESEVERDVNYCNTYFYNFKSLCVMRSTYKYPIMWKGFNIDSTANLL
jgi:hypothetical protein